MRKIMLLFLPLLLLVGCGRIVTDKTITDSSGNAVNIREAEFTFAFAGMPATDVNYKYYLVIATQNIGGNDLRLLQADGSLDYFASPDDANISSQNFSVVLTEYYSQVNSGANYNEALDIIYEQYFAKWAQYFVYDSVGQFLWRYGSGGGFTPSDQGRLTPQQAQPVSRAGNQLRWNIPLAALGDSFYFGLLTVQDTAGSPRRLMDGLGLIHLDTNKAEDLDNVPDRPGVIPPGLNIISYNVQIREY
ncbi:MAG: hypothetical protein LBJ25_03950 [Candidatus Margulisbacteria bacterium]|nr:hypothetical protein [Candidatus Margulisiibacteriota bacterium]